MKSGDIVAYKDSIGMTHTGIVGGVQSKDGEIAAVHVNGGWVSASDKLIALTVVSEAPSPPPAPAPPPEPEPAPEPAPILKKLSKAAKTEGK